MTFAALSLPAAAAIAGGAALGALIGSFMATIAVRWPAGQSILTARSACDHCHATLRWWELVPLFSWLALRGRCQRCGGSIAPAHPLMEMLAAVIGAVAMLVSPDAGGAALALLGWQLLLLGWLDARHYWLPHLLSGLMAASGIAIGGAAMAAIGLDASLPDRLIGAIVGFATLTLIAFAYRSIRGRDGLGGGDAPMLGAIGAWTGWVALPLLVLLASLAGLAVALARMAGAHWRTGQGSDEAVLTMQLPLGTLMALALPVALAIAAMSG